MISEGTDLIAREDIYTVKSDRTVKLMFGFRALQKMNTSLDLGKDSNYAAEILDENS